MPGVRTARVEAPKTLFDTTKNILHELEAKVADPGGTFPLGTYLDLVNQALLCLLVAVEHERDQRKTIEARIKQLEALEAKRAH